MPLIPRTQTIELPAMCHVPYVKFNIHSNESPSFKFTLVFLFYIFVYNPRLYVRSPHTVCGSPSRITPPTTPSAAPRVSPHHWFIAFFFSSAPCALVRMALIDAS